MQEQQQYNAPTAYRNLATPAIMLQAPSHFHLFSSSGSENLNTYHDAQQAPHGYSHYPPNSMQYISHPI